MRGEKLEDMIQNGQDVINASPDGFVWCPLDDGFMYTLEQAAEVIEKYNSGDTDELNVACKPRKLYPTFEAIEGISKSSIGAVKIDPKTGKIVSLHEQYSEAECPGKEWYLAKDFGGPKFWDAEPGMGQIRKEDIPYVKEVIQYLENKGLTVMLTGSAKERSDYEDIDLVATGDEAAVTAVVEEIREDLQKAEDGMRYGVNHICGPTNYAGQKIDNRFEVTVAKAKIDLCLKEGTLGT